MSSQHAVKRKGECPRLNDRQRLKIIALLEQPEPQSMRSIARQFGVDEKTIRRVKSTKDVIRERTQNVDQATQEATLRVSQKIYPVLENKLFQWIDDLRQMPIVISPELILQKVINIAKDLGISCDKFKPTFNWFIRFLRRYDLESINMHGELGEGLCNNESNEVNKFERTQKWFILNSLQNVVQLEVYISGLKSSSLISSDEINEAKSALFTLQHIFQSSITRQQI